MLIGYLGKGDFANASFATTRGRSNAVDLVDVLDGMMCRGHMSEAESEKLLVDVMRYRYDFTPPMPGGQCP